MGFERIYHQGREMKPDREAYNTAILVARNRLHRWWLRLRNPGMVVYLERWIKWRDIIDRDAQWGRGQQITRTAGAWCRLADQCFCHCHTTEAGTKNCMRGCRGVTDLSK